MKAQIVENKIANSEPAPKEWAEIEMVKNARPFGSDDNVSLQRLSGKANICQWWVLNRSGFGWVPASKCFLISK